MSIPPAHRTIWLAVMVQASVYLGTAAGILSWLAGATVPAALAVAGGAFSGALGLFLAIAGFLAAGGPHQRC
jgi:hypothetical protein